MTAGAPAQERVARDLQPVVRTLLRALETRRPPIQRNAIAAWAALVAELRKLNRDEDARGLARQLGVQLAELRQDRSDGLEDRTVEAALEALAGLEGDDQAAAFESLRSRSSSRARTPDAIQAAMLLIRMEGRWRGGLHLRPLARYRVRARLVSLTTGLTWTQGVPVLLLATVLVLTAWLTVGWLSARGNEIKIPNTLAAVSSALAATVAAVLIARPASLLWRWDARAIEVLVAATITTAAGYTARLAALLIVGMDSTEQDEPYLAATLFLGLLATRAATLSSQRGRLAVMVARGGLAGCLGSVVPFLAGLAEALTMPERAADSNLTAAWWTLLPTFASAGMGYGWADQMRDPTPPTPIPGKVQGRLAAPALAGAAVLFVASGLMASALRPGPANPIERQNVVGKLEVLCPGRSGTAPAASPNAKLTGVVLGWRYPVSFCSPGEAAIFTTTTPDDPDLELVWFPEIEKEPVYEDDPDPPALALEARGGVLKGTICLQDYRAARCESDALRRRSFSVGDLAIIALLRLAGTASKEVMEAKGDSRLYTIAVTRDPILVAQIKLGARGDEAAIRDWHPPPASEESASVPNRPGRPRSGYFRPQIRP